MYSEIVIDEFRNQLIADDVISAFKKGRNSLVLTERTANVAGLAKKLIEKIPDVITITGNIGARETRKSLTKVTDISKSSPLTIMAMGKYIGEWFDEAMLDTLFLAMPISWEGTLQQYAVRLHRLFKKKVRFRFMLMSIFRSECWVRCTISDLPDMRQLGTRKSQETSPMNRWK
jgi:hypothetical protein